MSFFCVSKRRQILAVCRFYLLFCRYFRNFETKKVVVSPSKCCSMDIFTSCFSRARSLDPNRYLVVSISRFPPKWFGGLCCYDLAPSVSLLHDFHKGLSWSSYVCRYQSDVLDRVDIKSVLASIAKNCGGRDLVLCCFESSPLHCHRSLVASHVFSLYGYSIKDL